MNIERYLIETNNFCPFDVGEWIKLDEKIMANFKLCVMAINNSPKYTTSKQRKRKLKATKAEFLDLFLIRVIKSKIIKTNIINDSIKKHFEKNDMTYEELMAELDEILNTPISPINKECPLECRKIGLGICFCRKPNGDYYY